MATAELKRTSLRWHVWLEVLNYYTFILAVAVSAGALKSYRALLFKVLKCSNY